MTRTQNTTDRDIKQALEAITITLMIKRIDTRDNHTVSEQIKRDIESTISTINQLEVA